MDAYYPQLQDLFVKIRKARKSDDDITKDMAKDWEEALKEIDKVNRDRLFILTVAAEKGWVVAADLAFGMRGMPKEYEQLISQN